MPELLFVYALFLQEMEAPPAARSAAKKLLLRTLAQYAALKKCKKEAEIKTSYDAIVLWFAPGMGLPGHSFHGYQPSKSAVAQLITGADDGRHRALKIIFALRMWLQQHNDKLPEELQEADLLQPPPGDGQRSGTSDR